MIRFCAFIGSIVLTIAPLNATAKNAHKITAAKVEETDTAQIIRLAIANRADLDATVQSKKTGTKMDLQSKVVCGSDSIRVRIFDVSTKSPDVVSLPLSDTGPLRQVRLIPRVGKGTVVQLFRKGGAFGGCDRTTTFQQGGEFFISMSFSKTDIARKKRIMEARRQIAAVTSAAVMPAAQATPGASSKSSGAKQDLSSTQQKTSKKNLTKRAKTDAKEDPSESKTASVQNKRPAKKLNLAATSDETNTTKTTRPELESDFDRYLLGFGFASLVAGLAWYLKRRKSTGGLSGDSIEILSSKRLGAHQKLVVAEVQGSKFLLAVSDRSTTTLGMLPDEPQPLAITRTNVVPVAPEIPATPPEQVNTSITEQFQSKLEQALSQAAPAPSPPPEPQRPKPTPPLAVNSKTIPSNVTGLIAMARMRAGLAGADKNEPRAEA